MFISNIAAAISDCVVALAKIFRAFLLHKMTHPYYKLLKSMKCRMKLHTRKAEYKQYIKTMASGVLHCGTSSKHMHRIIKCLLILITVNIIIYNVFSDFLSLAHDISYVESVCKVVNKGLHILNWKYLNTFIPKTSRRSGKPLPHVVGYIMPLTLRLLMSYIYMEHLFLMFLDHTQRRTTVDRTPLDE